MKRSRRIAEGDPAGLGHGHRCPGHAAGHSRPTQGVRCDRVGVSRVPDRRMPHRRMHSSRVPDRRMRGGGVVEKVLDDYYQSPYQVLYQVVNEGVHDNSSVRDARFSLAGLLA